MKALIDGDIIVYRCAFAAEHNMRQLTWSDEEGNHYTETFQYRKDMLRFIEGNKLTDYSIETTLDVEPLENVLFNVKSTISTILGAVKPSEYLVVLSGKGNFRFDAATIKKYKGNRDMDKRPHWYNEARDYLTRYYDSVVTENEEADDVLAREQTDDTVIVSLDKDLLQVPGRHYNWVSDKKVLVSKETALKNLYTQVLTGDSTDNIPGIYGIGPKKADVLLEAGIEHPDDYFSYLGRPWTQEDVYKEVCVQQWDKYLRSEKPPEWLSSFKQRDKFNREADEHEFMYYHWDSQDPCFATAEGIVDELLKLLKVG